MESLIHPLDSCPNGRYYCGPAVFVIQGDRVLEQLVDKQQDLVGLGHGPRFELLPSSNVRLHCTWEVGGEQQLAGATGVLGLRWQPT